MQQSSGCFLFLLLGSSPGHCSDPVKGERPGNVRIGDILLTYKLIGPRYHLPELPRLNIFLLDRINRMTRIFCLHFQFPASLQGVGSPLRTGGRPVGAYPPAWKPTGWKRPRWDEIENTKSLYEGRNILSQKPLQRSRLYIPPALHLHPLM